MEQDEMVIDQEQIAPSKIETLCYSEDIVTIVKNNGQNERVLVEISKLKKNTPELFNAISTILIPYPINSQEIQLRWKERMQGNMEILMVLPYLPYGISTPVLFQAFTAIPDKSNVIDLNQKIEDFMRLSQEEQHTRSSEFSSLQKKLKYEKGMLSKYAENSNGYEMQIDATEVLLLYMEIFEVLRISDHPQIKKNEDFQNRVTMAESHRDEKVRSLITDVITGLESHDIVQVLKHNITKKNPEFFIYSQNMPENSVILMKALASIFFKYSFMFMINYIRTYELSICIILDIPKKYWKDFITPANMKPMNPHLFSERLRKKLHEEQYHKMKAMNDIVQTFDIASVTLDKYSFRGCLSNYALVQMIECFMRKDITQSLNEKKK